MLSPLVTLVGARSRPWVLLVAATAASLVWFDRSAAVPLAMTLSATLLLRHAGSWRQLAAAGAVLPIAAALPLSAGAWPLGALAGMCFGLWLGACAAGPLRDEPTRPTASPCPTWLLTLSGLLGLAALAWLTLRVLPWGWSVAALVIGVVLVLRDVGVVRRTGAALGAAALVGICWSPLAVVVALAAPILRARRIPAWYVLPGVLVLPVGEILPSALAVLLAGWVWDRLPSATRPAWRVLPPIWRVFTAMKLRLDPVYALLQRDPSPWRRVLDLGCGNGLGALIAQRRGDATHWHGIDLDRRKLDIARLLLDQLPGTSAWTLTCAHLPLPEPCPADTILALDILHYWPLDEQSALLRWMRACLTADGVLWLRDGTTDGAGATRIAHGERFTTAIGLNPASSLYFRSEADWTLAFTAAGFAVTEVHPAGAANRLWRLVSATN